MPCSKPEPLDKGHDLEDFSCGEPALDDWLKRRALPSQASDASRVYVTTERGRVVGCYALANAQVAPEDTTERARKGQPQERPIPAILLARLAVDHVHQRTGIGSSLLQDAMLRIEQAADQIAARVLLVHAKNEEARRWYLQFGFDPSPTDPLHLLLLLEDLREFLRRTATSVPEESLES